MEKITLSGLSRFGLSLDSEIEGLMVTGVKQTNRKNVFALQMKNADGKRTVNAFVGAKSIEEGLLASTDKGEAVIAPGFEVYRNNDNEAWIRNKATAQKKLEVIG